MGYTRYSAQMLKRMEYKQKHVYQLLHTIIEGQRRMTIEFDRLVTEVAETKDAVSVVLAKVSDLNAQIADLIAQIADAAGDAAEVTRLADELNAVQEQIAAVVAPVEAPVEPVVE